MAFVGKRNSYPFCLCWSLHSEKYCFQESEQLNVFNREVKSKLMDKIALLQNYLCNTYYVKMISQKKDPLFFGN